MIENLQKISFDNYIRRYGVEIEVNASDGMSKPVIENTLPQGIFHVGQVVCDRLKSQVEVTKWHHTHHNKIWVIKPDSSCGMEVCSPVSKGQHGLKKICDVVDALYIAPEINSDRRCSFHVHIEIADLTTDQLACVLSYWVKCEWVFMHSMPFYRKRNKYCQLLGATDLFEHDAQYTSSQLISKLGNYKYYSLNTYHFLRGKRPTIEFRIAGHEACMDKDFAKNWIMLLVHFIEVCKDRVLPGAYEKGNPWSSYLWLNPTEVFDLLQFKTDVDLDDGMKEVRNWFGNRIKCNIRSHLGGVWSDEAVNCAFEDFNNLAFTA